MTESTKRVTGVQARVRKFFETNTALSYTLEDLAESLPGLNPGSINGACCALLEKGEVERVGAGTYRSTHRPKQAHNDLGVVPDEELIIKVVAVQENGRVVVRVEDKGNGLWVLTPAKITYS